MMKFRIKRFSVRHWNIIIGVYVGEGNELQLFCVLWEF